MLRLFASLLLGASITTASAQESYPSRNVKIVVPSPPGAATDVIARVIAQHLQANWGKPVVVENRPGADEMIGADVVAKSPPDGHTLLVISTGGMSAAPHLHKDIKYDSQKDFTLLKMIGQVTPVMSVPTASGVRSVQELIALAKSRPGALNYGSYGNGSYVHVAMEDFKLRTGVDIMHVPYRGAAPAVTAILQNEIAVLIGNLGTIQPHADSGAVRIIASTGEKRAQLRPDLPTVAESGVPGFSTNAWWAMFGPAGMPAPIIAKVRADVEGALASAEAKKVFEASTLERIVMTPEEFDRFYRAEFVRWGQLIRAANIKLD